MHRLDHTSTTLRAAGPLGLVVVFALLAALVAGCIWNTPQQRRYYTMVQASSTHTASTRVAEDLWVKEVEIASIYDRPQIVFRYSPTELRYFSLERWADRPTRMFNQHLIQVMRSSGLFRSVSDRLGTAPPAYVLDTMVTAIEQLDGGDVWYAHLAMTFRLSRFGENETLWEYGFSQRRPLNDRDVALSVRAFSEILDEEMRVALRQIEAKLTGRPPPEDERPETKRPTVRAPQAHSGQVTRGTPEVETVSSAMTRDGVTLTGDGEPLRGWGTERVDWRKSAQYNSDPTVVPAGKGAVFLPALGGEPDREPSVEVFQDGDVVASGPMGRRISLDPGTYQVRFGSGSLSQRMVREVDVEEGRISIIEPDWSALEISVVDDKFIPWRGSYEINDRVRAEYIGLGHGADEEQGERTQVWVLPPGIYKIVQPGASFRTRTNFATVQLPPGDFVPFVVVMDESTGDFLGAGVADPEDEGALVVDDRWSVRSSIGGDFFWNSRSGLDSEVGTELAVSFFLDNMVRYRHEQHLWTTRFEIEESHRLLSRTSADGTRQSLFSGEFEPVIDRFYANSLYIYELLSWAGPYMRMGGETSLFPRNRSVGPEQGVLVFDEQGGLLDTHAPGTKDRVRLAGPFSPFEFKEGVGVNFRVLHTPTVSFDLRLGMGARQYLSLGQLLINEERSAELDAVVLERATNSFLIGPETTIVASARLTRYLQGTTEFDSLTPFGTEDSTRFTWRSTISLRLSNFASLIYTVNLDQNPNVGREEPLHFDQGLRLRLSYIIF